MDVPGWLTKDFLVELLENNQDIPGCKIEIINHDIRAAIPKGNNYLSDIFRVNIEYKVHGKSGNHNSESIRKVSLIAKVPLKKGLFVELTKGGIVEKEFGAYKHLLPKLNSIVQQHNDKALSPKLYKNDIESIMILEDLVVSGYKMKDRKNQLDYEHTVVALKHLAKFHAASVKLHESEPELVEKYGKELIFRTEMDPEVKQILDPLLGEQHIDTVCDEFKKWPDTKKHVDFIRKLKPRVWDIHLTGILPRDDEFTVLNHGDLWTNNMLFKYDENSKPYSVKFVDYQILRYTSPASDILYLMCSSVRFEVYKKHFEDLVNIYLKTLNSYLAKYGSSKRLEKEELQRSLKNRELLIVTHCITLLPFMFAEFNEDNSCEDPNALSHLISNEHVRTTCARFLDHFSTEKWYQNYL